MCSRSRSRSKVTWYEHFCNFTKIDSSCKQIAGSWPNLHTMVCRRARIHDVLKVKVKGHVIRALLWCHEMFAVQYRLTFCLCMRSLYETPLYSHSSISIRQLSTYWNELLRHWRSGWLIHPCDGDGQTDRQTDGIAIAYVRLAYMLSCKNEKSMEMFTIYFRNFERTATDMHPCLPLGYATGRYRTHHWLPTLTHAVSQYHLTKYQCTSGHFEGEHMGTPFPLLTSCRNAW